MRFAALLGAIALLPISFVVGWSLHKQPAPPFGVYAASELHVRHVPGQDSDDWLAVAVTGPNKGGSMDLFQALAAFPTHKALEESAQGKVKYYELKCAMYSTGASKVFYAAENVVRKCSSTPKSRKEAEDYMVTLLQPSPKS